MNLEGRICRLRAVEPRDVETMYRWENDTEVWSVSGTTAPYSRELLERFVEQQRFDIWQTRQMRLMIEPLCGTGDDRGRSGDKSSVSPETAHADKPAETVPVAAPRFADEAGGTTARKPSTDSAERALQTGFGKTVQERRNSGGDEFGNHICAPVGALDLFEFDPQHRRAGIGILIHDPEQRGKGFAADALDIVCRYAHAVLGLHQLWCNVGADNTASLALFRRAGFTESGLKRDWQWTPDGFRDEIMMQLIFNSRL